MARRKKSVEDLMYDNTVGVATGRTKRKGIQHKSPDDNLWGSRNMNAADLKNPNSEYRRMANYRLTGKDSFSRGGETVSSKVDADNYYRAWNQAKNQGKSSARANKEAAAAAAEGLRYMKSRNKKTQGQAKLAGNTPGKVAKGKIVGAVYGGAKRTQATRGINESLGRKAGTPIKRAKTGTAQKVAHDIINGTNRVFANDGRTTVKKSTARGKSELSKVAKRKQVRAGKARRARG